MKLVIPMAGEGSRFKQAGYVKPKPFIDIDGKSMIELVLENLEYRIFSEVILLVRKEHLEYFAKIGKPKSVKLVVVDSLTEGAACTLLHAYDYLNCSEPIVIANSDQYLENFSMKSFTDFANFDGAIVCFESDGNPKWSYAKVDNGFVDLVAEKKPISSLATVGIYYFSSGKELIRSAVGMIVKNIRTNNEFYICPIYNEMIKAKKQITAFVVDKNSMWGLGTPEDLAIFNDRDK